MNREKIEFALKRLNYTKGQLMELVYGGNFGGIDSAIPQDYVDNYLTGENLYYYVTDCRTFPFKVVNLLDKLSDEKKAYLYIYVDLIADLEAYRIGFSSALIMSDYIRGKLCAQ